MGSSLRHFLLVKQVLAISRQTAAVVAPQAADLAVQRLDSVHVPNRLVGGLEFCLVAITERGRALQRTRTKIGPIGGADTKGSLRHLSRDQV